ncbi:uncharacterized protein Dvar_36160 [Desulfosarcina variabilis str. Montpellier]|jgi:transcriptional regulator with XRE-family HTH domain|uniref:helix-turn-helix domain-containing protein n=1 Tax=Desulfosarcina variabilis TaxID=2300 RepID=UPI003AFB39CF
MSENNNNIKHEITQRIVAIAGENPAEFARRAGITDQSFRMYLKGSMPSAPALLKIALAGGVSADWLLSGKSPTQDLSIENVVDVEHVEIIKTFKNKTLAKELNKILKKIEDIDGDHLREIKGMLRSELAQLQLKSEFDRRKGERRKTDGAFDGDEKRSGNDRRNSTGH